MTDLDRAILDLLRSGPASLAPLRAHHPRESLYRAARALRSRGLVAGGRGRWELTPAGERALAPEPTGERVEVAPPAGLLVPALPLMPTAIHGAVAELAILAAGARRRHPRHHLSFVLAGPPLRAKTWLMLALARVLGADPATSILHAGVQTAAGLGARRNSKGEIAAVRAALASPLLAVDEWQRGSSAVRRATHALLHGERSLALENDEALDVNAVVVLGLNPSEGETLEERLGLDAALVRRALVADFARATLPDDFAARGEELLDEIAALGPVALPEPRRGVDEHEVRELVRSSLVVTLDSPERLAQLDVIALGQLAIEATGWLEDTGAAVAMVLADALTIYETTGWACEGWRERLAAHAPATTSSDQADESPPPVDAPPVIATEEANRYDYEARLLELDSACRRANTDAKTAALIIDRAHTLADLGGTVEGLRYVEGLLRRLGTDEAGAEAALALALELRALGMNPKNVRLLAREFEAANLEPREGARWIGAMIARYDSLARAIESQDIQLEARQKDVERVVKQLTGLRTEYRVLKQTIEELRRDPETRPLAELVNARALDRVLVTLGYTPWAQQ